jgi:hypothetical protein
MTNYNAIEQFEMILHDCPNEMLLELKRQYRNDRGGNHQEIYEMICEQVDFREQAGTLVIQ